MKIPAGCAIGAFINGMENLSSFQTMIGRKLAAVLWYVHWLDPFPLKEIEIADKNGSVPLITWEPWIKDGLEAIVCGQYERYIEEFFEAAKKWGKPILLRFAHEMNGNWYPWDGFHNAASPEKYKQAWLYIYNVREQVGASKVFLVWCPNNTNQPDEPWNRARAYYPGDQYVDWLGMDGYNWGYSRWQDFDSVFKNIYAELTELTWNKPMMIGEFASAGGKIEKSGWIKEALSKIKTDYPRIKLVCWFNINKERDWRINSCPDIGKSFSDSYFEEEML